MPKWMDDRNMKNMVIRSIGTESKAPMERFLVLNPPVAVTLIAWHTASRGPIPASK